MTNIISNGLILQHQKDGLINNINADCIGGVVNHSFNKKVKFGPDVNQTAVETFLYDNQTVGATIPFSDYKLLKYERPELTTLSSPTKLKVEIVDSQIPIQISPPVADVNFSSSASASSHHRPTSHHYHSRPSSTEPTTSAATKHFPPTAPTTTAPAPLASSNNVALIQARPLLTSTPLPHYQPTGGMDYDNENPFRPNGVLSHEVEPIIEEYKQKPFPNSPNRSAANTPLPLAHQQENLVANESSSFNANDSTDSKLRLITDNMSSGGNAASNGVSNVATPPKGNVIEQADVQSHLVTPTKAGKVELVHVENKKKKCCCCVQ